MKKTSRRSRSGFTLVELLVVIGIIAILISILLPSLARARKAAQTVACASNLRSIMQATHIFATQNNGYLPGSVYSSGRFLFIDPVKGRVAQLSRCRRPVLVHPSHSPGGIGAFSSSLISLTRASVVSRSAAIEAAF